MKTSETERESLKELLFGAFWFVTGSLIMIGIFVGPVIIGLEKFTETTFMLGLFSILFFCLVVGSYTIAYKQTKKNIVMAEKFEAEEERQRFLISREQNVT